MHYYKCQRPKFVLVVNTCASGILICSTVCLVESHLPGDLFSFILIMFLSRAYSLRIYKSLPKHFYFGPLHFFTGLGNALISSLVNTELKCIFNSSAIKNPCFIMFPAVSMLQPNIEQVTRKMIRRLDTDIVLSCWLLHEAPSFTLLSCSYIAQ